MVKPHDDMRVEIVGDGADIFVTVDDVKIAKRGSPGTPQAKTWVALEPGWTVLDQNPEAIMVMHDGVRVH